MKTRKQVILIYLLVSFGILIFLKNNCFNSNALTLDQYATTIHKQIYNYQKTQLPMKMASLQEADEHTFLNFKKNVEILLKLSQDNFSSDMLQQIMQMEIAQETKKAQNDTYTSLTGLTFSSQDQLRLDQFFDSFSDRLEVSVYIRMLDDGSTYLYNPLATYYTASIAKAPFALYLYQGYEQGLFSLSDYQKHLISLMISKSDNDATVSLASIYPTYTKSYRDFLETIGFTDPYSSTISTTGINGNMNVIDAGHTMVSLYDYFNQQTDGALALQNDFLNYDYDLPLLNFPYPMAKKWGMFASVNHDMAIVYGKRPFVICVVTNDLRGVYSDLSMNDPYHIMETTSQLVYEILED